MIEILNEYLKFLWSAFQYDMNVFSQGWIYYCLLIPASFYLIFFMLKWAIITAPFWIPIRMVFGGLKSLFSFKINRKG